MRSALIDLDPLGTLLDLLPADASEDHRAMVDIMISQAPERDPLERLPMANANPHWVRAPSGCESRGDRVSEGIDRCRPCRLAPQAAVRLVREDTA